MAMGMWCDSLVMRVLIDEPQTTAPCPDSLKLRPLLWGRCKPLSNKPGGILSARAPERSCAAKALERKVNSRIDYLWRRSLETRDQSGSVCREPDCEEEMCHSGCAFVNEHFGNVPMTSNALSIC